MATLAVNQLPLAPLGAGDLIDRTVRLYRQHFMALIRASAPPVLISAAGAVLWVVGVRALALTQSGAWLAVYSLSAVVGVLLIAVGYVFHLIVMGGASYTLVRHLLWDEPVTARAVYRSVRARFWRLLGATLAVALFVVFAFGLAVFLWYIVVVIAVVGFIAGVGVTAGGGGFMWVVAAAGLVCVVAAGFGALWVFFALAGRVVYVPQVLLVEGKGVFASVARSAQLARGNVRRLMAMFLFTTFATYSALMLLLIPLGWYGYLHGINPFDLNYNDWPTWYAIGRQVVTQASTILLTPVWMLGLSLLYVDERVRHEAYDVELMAARVFGEMPAVPRDRISPLAPAIVSTTPADAAPANVNAAATAGGSAAPPRDNDSFNTSVLGL